MSEDSKKGAPDWIVTFSDIISLLVTFFILLLTWSTLEVEEFELVRGSLQGALGVVGMETDASALYKRPTAYHGRSDDQGMLHPPEGRMTDESFKGLAIRLKKRFGEELDLDKLHQGYRIRIAADTLFERGSARLTGSSRAALEAIAAAVRDIYNPVRVEGHTDDLFRGSSDYPTAWDLSVARATAAARFLAQAGPVRPQRISVAGYAGHRPAFPNRSPALRARNRRIELVILARRRKQD
ncbi:MAG: flagellar motor protein MotB [Candidatus Brocadiia bacterium]